MKEIFDPLRERYEKDDFEREQVIIKCRKINKLSKEIIYSINRKDMDSAENHSQEIKKKVKDLVSADTRHYFQGAFRVAIQEYVEALAYLVFVKEGRLFSFEEAEIPDICYEYYLLGVCDLSGELVRKSLGSGIDSDFDDIKKTRDFITNLYDELLKFDFRNGEIRKKFDSLRWDLQKIEDMVFNLKLKDKI